MRPIILLGPQRLAPTLVEEVAYHGIDGQIAAVTAGWQEREEEDDELRAHLERPVVNLMLHERCEQAFDDDPELFRAHRERQDRLRAMQQLYRYRLDFAIKPARSLLRRTGDPEVLEPERRAAIEAVRRLDAEHLERIAAVHREFERRMTPERRPAMARHRWEIERILERSAALAIAGGHVAVLVNRLRLLGIAELARELPVFAWSAGAMAIAERVVLFHDHPPQGAGSAEVLDLGLGLFPGLLPLPHARRRLRLGDRHRVMLLARRFAPMIAAPLDEKACLYWNGERWRAGGDGATRLDVDGTVEPMEAA